MVQAVSLIVKGVKVVDRATLGITKFMAEIGVAVTVATSQLLAMLIVNEIVVAVPYVPCVPVTYIMYVPIVEISLVETTKDEAAPDVVVKVKTAELKVV